LIAFAIYGIYLELLLDGESYCHIVGLLDWSLSASERRYGLGAVDNGCLRIDGGQNGFLRVNL